MKIKTFVKKKIFLSLNLYVCFVIILLKCGYQIPTYVSENQSEFSKNTQLQLLLCSYDSFNMITRIVRNEFISNNFIILNNSDYIYDKFKKQLIPYLNIISSSENHINISILPDGTVSEYKIILKLQVQFFIPQKKNLYPVDILVSRTFMHNPALVLSDLIQENEILNDMYQEAAQKLVQRFLAKLYN